MIIPALALAVAACAPAMPSAPTAAPEATSAAPAAREAGVLILATTTSTEDSGLLDAILPGFEAAEGVDVQVIAVGTGQALALGAAGDADVLLVHARAQEDAFVAEGNGVNRRDVMYNDFVLVGPADDPVGVKDIPKAQDALAQIASAGAPFASRGDKSGTHSKELALWKAAALTPVSGENGYVELGQGMGETLNFANETGAYTLTDRATWLASQSNLPDLAVMVGGTSIDANPDTGLYNPYGVIAVNPEKFPHVNAALAERFIAWITSAEVQAEIGAFGKDQYGQSLFFASAATPLASQGQSSTLPDRGGLRSPRSHSVNHRMIESFLPIVTLTLSVSGIALIIASVLGFPLGAWLALARVPGKRLIEALIYTGMAFPPVVVGLAVYMLLSRSGPLGWLGWLFTPSAMITAQVVIALPMVAGLTQSAIEGLDPALRLQLRALGASPAQTMWTLLAEARAGVIAALIAAFGSIISEVGAVMLVGGNIAGSTRVMTTAIVLETRQGEFELALALGAVLLSLTFVINFAIMRLGQRREVAPR